MLRRTFCTTCPRRCTLDARNSPSWTLLSDSKGLSITSAPRCPSFLLPGSKKYQQLRIIATWAYNSSQIYRGRLSKLSSKILRPNQLRSSWHLVWNRAVWSKRTKLQDRTGQFQSSICRRVSINSSKSSTLITIVKHQIRRLIRAKESNTLKLLEEVRLGTVLILTQCKSEFLDLLHDDQSCPKEVSMEALQAS